jgi:single-strand DNA-binding protein
MNKVILLGRLVNEPELRYTTNNTACCKFRIAVNKPGKQAEGQPTADFFQITAWKQVAEFVEKYFSKGQQVLIEGTIRNNNYTDKNGIQHYTNDIHATQVYFADSKRDKSDDVSKVDDTQGFYSLSENDEDLPF